MERKKVQRIIGVIVVVALVIVLIPLLFHKNDNPITTAANTKSPTFPEAGQPKTINDLSDPDVVPSDAKMDPINIAPKIADATNQTLSMTPIKQTTSVNQDVQSNNATIQTASSDDASTLEDDEEQGKTKASPVAKANVKNNKTTLAKNNQHKDQDLHKRAWVVQMGSFKEKSNARRLADKLRSAGFKAFMHSVKSKKGEQTRVYIGPETKLVEASSLSKKIEHQLNLKGIIVSYKPLEL